MAVTAVAVLMLRPTPVSLACGLLAGRLAGAMATTMLYRRRVGRIRIGLEPGGLRRLFVAGSPLALRSGLGSLSFRVDMLFLGAMRPAREVGWYGSIYALMDGLIMLPDIVKGSFGPSISANFSEGRKEVINRLYQRGLKYLGMAGLFLGAVLAILADPIVGILYGNEYAAAASVLRILAFAALFIFMRSYAVEVLDNVDKHALTVWIFAVGLIVNVVLNLLLIPRWGYLGAGTSMLATEAYLVVVMLWVLRREGHPARLVKLMRSPLLAIIPPLFLMSSLIDRPFLAGALGGLIYLAGLTVWGGWDDKERDLATRLLTAALHRIRR